MEQLRQLKAGDPGAGSQKRLELEISLGQELRYFEELPLYLEQGRALTLAESGMLWWNSNREMDFRP